MDLRQYQPVDDGSRGMLRKALHCSQMDFEYAFTQMLYLLTSPSKVYKLTRWRKETKNRWARDDPAFIILQTWFLIVAVLGFGFALGTQTVIGCVWLVAFNLLLFYGFGSFLATGGWWISNHFFRVQHSHSVEQEVEWVYAFDIHCNAFFPLFVLLYVGQYLFLPLLIDQSLFSIVAGNTLYAVALGYYVYVNFLGYMYLPFLHKEKVTCLLYPAGLVFLLYLCFTILQISVARLVLGI